MVILAIFEASVVALTLFLCYTAGLSWFESRSYAQDRAGSVIAVIIAAMCLYISAALLSQMIEMSHPHWPLSYGESEVRNEQVLTLTCVLLALCILSIISGWYFNRRSR